MSMSGTPASLNPAQILIVDDDPDDRMLVIRELRKEFSNVEITEVIDQGSFERALHQPHFSLVITDYQLLWTDGISVLKRVKARWPDCPVVMFTGTGSEEIAVEAMKSGLDDYVLKSPRHYARLPAAAQRAIQVARQKRELRDAEHRYTVLFDSVPVGLYRATAAGEILDANPALVERLGYPDAKEVVGLNLADFFVQLEEYQAWREQMVSDGLSCNFETRLHCKDGRTCWVENSARAVVDPETRETFYEGRLEDITARKKAEDEREQLIAELQDALAKVKTLSGLLPICSSCKRIRDDKGYWNQIEVFIQVHSDAEFTHSVCPECMKRLYPEICEGEAKWSVP